MKLYYSTDGRLVTTYSVWSENDFIFSISSCFNREGGGGTEVVPLVPASLDQSGQCYLWFSTFFSSRRRGFPKIGFTGRPSTVHLHTFTLAYFYTCILVHLHTCTLAYLCTCIFVHLHTCTLTNWHTCTLIYLITHILAH